MMKMIRVFIIVCLAHIAVNGREVMGIGERVSNLQMKPHGSVPVRAGLQTFVASFGGCSAIKSKTVKINCTHKLDKIIQGIDCSKKVPAGTKAYFTCPNNTYMVEKYDMATCGVPTKKKWSNKVVKCRSSDFTSTTISTSSIETNVSTDAIVSDLPSSSEETTISSDTPISEDTTSSSTELAPTTVLSTISSSESSTTTAAVATANTTTATNTSGTMSAFNNSSTTSNTANAMATSIASASTLLSPITSTATTLGGAVSTLLISTVAGAVSTTPAVTVASAVIVTPTVTVAGAVSTIPTVTDAAPVTTTPAVPVAATTTAAIITTAVTEAVTTPATTTVAVLIPPGYVFVDGVGTVKTSAVPKTYCEAKAECAIDGGTLYVTNSLKKNIFIASVAATANYVGASNTNNIWVAIVNTGKGWRTPQGVDVKLIPTFKWAVGKPYASSQCAAYAKQWAAHTDMKESCWANASTKFPYICELLV